MGLTVKNGQRIRIQTGELTGITPLPQGEIAEFFLQPPVLYNLQTDIVSLHPPHPYHHQNHLLERSRVRWALFGVIGGGAGMLLVDMMALK